MGIYKYSLTETAPFGHGKKINYQMSAVVVFFLFANKMEMNIGSVLLKMKVNIGAFKKSQKHDWLPVTILYQIRHVDRLLTSSEEKRMIWKQRNEVA